MAHVWGSEFYHLAPNRERRKARPGFGARHPISYKEGANREIRNMFGMLTDLWAGILPDVQRGDTRNSVFRQQFAVSDKPQKVCVPVLEGRPIREYTNKRRIPWTSHEAGIISAKVGDAISRLGITDAELPVTFDKVVIVGSDDAGGGKRQLAALVAAECETAEVIPVELEAAVAQVERRFPGFTYPVPPATYTGRLSLGFLDPRVSEDDAERCVSAAQSLLPLSGALLSLCSFSDEIAA